MKNTKDFKGFAIRAQDGDLGTVDDLYFDDQSWVVRYLTVVTSGWLEGRQVLISPVAVLRVNWESKSLDVSLTKLQVEKSPDIDTHQPVSRQHEAEYLGYYGYPVYWGDVNMLSPMPFPMGMVTRPAVPTDSHLRSCAAVTGYHIETVNGNIGHADGFLIDDQSWSIRYIEVATRNWWPGKKVLLSPGWISKVSWEESSFSVDLAKETIQSAPDYVESEPVSREYEHDLFLHYGRPPYWIKDAKPEASLEQTVA